MHQKNIMTREQKCELAIEKGFSYNQESGNIYGVRGNIIKRKNKAGYIVLYMYNEKNYYSLYGHQFAWYWNNKKCVDSLDHINGIKDDNRLCNLREVTHQENMWNITKAKGYYWNKLENKWKSQIKIDNKVIGLGTFNNEEEAKKAYLDAKEKYRRK